MRRSKPKTCGWLRERCMNVCGRSTHSQETITAIDRSSLRRSERDGCFDPTQSALYCDLNPLARKGLTVCLHVGGYPVILFYLTWLAPLRIVFQPFVGEEELFPRGEYKFFTAINTSQYLVLVFVHSGPPTPCSLVGSVLPVLRDRKTSFLTLAASYLGVGSDSP